MTEQELKLAHLKQQQTLLALMKQPQVKVTRSNYLIGGPYKVDDLIFDLYGEYKHGEYYLNSIALHGTLIDMGILLIKYWDGIQIMLDDLAEDEKQNTKDLRNEFRRDLQDDLEGRN